MPMGLNFNDKSDLRNAGSIRAQSQIYENQINTMEQPVPIHHLGLAVLGLVGFVCVIGYVNHRANH